jgi:hypothetical protein
MPPFLTSTVIPVTSEDIQNAVDAYLDANPVDITDHTNAADPHPNYQLESAKAQANGYPSLNGSGVIPDNQIGSTIARDTEITTQITSHSNAADPHGDRNAANVALAAHTSLTSNVHGIANAALLETLAGSQAKVDAHNALSTNVHGVSDLSAVVLNTSPLLWPQRVFDTDDQTEPPGAVEGDFWIAPEV